MGWDYAPTREHETHWAPQNRAFLQNLIGRNIEYPTQQTADMSSFEKQGLGSLQDIIDGKAFADPANSRLYAGLRESSKIDEAEGVASLRHRQQLGGMFASSPGGRAEADYTAKRGAERDTMLGSLYETERARDNPYTRLAASQQFGSLPRQIEQNKMNADYQSSLQTMLAPFQLQAPLANSLLDYAPWEQAGYTDTKTGSTFLSQAAPFIGQAASMFGMGGLGSLAGSAASGLGSLWRRC